MVRVKRLACAALIASATMTASVPAAAVQTTGSFWDTLWLSFRAASGVTYFMHDTTASGLGWANCIGLGACSPRDFAASITLYNLTLELGYVLARNRIF